MMSMNHKALMFWYSLLSVIPEDELEEYFIEAGWFNDRKDDGIKFLCIRKKTYSGFNFCYPDRMFSMWTWDTKKLSKKSVAREYTFVWNLICEKRNYHDSHKMDAKEFLDLLTVLAVMREVKEENKMNENYIAKRGLKTGLEIGGSTSTEVPDNGCPCNPMEDDKEYKKIVTLKDWFAVNSELVYKFQGYIVTIYRDSVKSDKSVLLSSCEKMKKEDLLGLFGDYYIIEWRTIQKGFDVLIRFSIYDPWFGMDKCCCNNGTGTEGEGTESRMDETEEKEKENG